jgi:zinc transport system permease protein
VLGALALLWRPLLRLTLHEELAAAEGLPVVALQLAFLLLLAIVVATAMKVVGIVLITALLILPAAAARRLAASPEAMAVGAAAVGSLAVGGGLWASWTWDTPSGPSIVVTALLLFVLLQAAPRRVAA